jgi:hypothetical protein
MTCDFSPVAMFRKQPLLLEINPLFWKATPLNLNGLILPHNNQFFFFAKVWFRSDQSIWFDIDQ